MQGECIALLNAHNMMRGKKFVRAGSFDECPWKPTEEMSITLRLLG